MFDPFANIDPFKAFDNIGRIPGLDDGGVRPQRPEFRRPLPPEESESIGRQALDAGKSGLSYVLGSIGKVDRAARGVLAGQGPHALKNLIPFSDTLGITDEHKDDVSGRDLTDMYGITDKNDKGWGAWGLGLAADVGTSPLTYMSFGANHALNATGKALKGTGALKGWSREALLKGFDATESGLAAAGRTAPEIAHMVDQGRRIATPAMEAAAGGSIVPGEALSGLVRAGVPFGPGITLGSGKIAQGVARGLDATGDFLRYKVPGAKALGALFDSPRGGGVHEITQRGYEQFADPALQAGKAVARENSFNVLKQLDPLIQKHGLANEAMVTRATNAAVEGAGEHLFPPNISADVQGLGGDIRAMGPRQIQEAHEAGAPLSDLTARDPFVHYNPRHALDVNHRSLQIGGRAGARTFWPTTSGANIQRNPLLVRIPGGGARLDDWIDRFAATPAAGSAPVIRQELESDLLQRGMAMTPELAKEFDKKAADLAKFYESSSASRRTDHLPLFTPNTAGNVAQRGMQHARTIANTKGLLGTLGLAAEELNPARLDMIPITDALNSFKLYSAGALKNQAIEGAIPQLYRRLAPKGAGMVEDFKPGELLKMKAEMAGRWGISKEHFDQITHDYNRWSSPEQIKGPVKWIDSLTNAFKGLAYPMWIPSHVRNSFTAIANNLRDGVTWGDYMSQLQAMTGRGARDLSGIHPSLAGLSTPEQNEALRGLQFKGGNVFGGHGMNEDIISDVPKAMLSGGGNRFTPAIPGSDRSGAYGNLAADTADLVLNKGLLGTVKNLGRTGLGMVSHPFSPSKWGVGENLGIKGVAGATEDVLPAVKSGRMAGTNVEDFFRGSQMNALMRKGYTPEMAGARMNQLHFDYDNLTSFEKNVMRRLVPFYTFARRNIPLQLETLATQPGITANTYKPFMQQTPGEPDPYIPAYLNSGAVMPLGQEQDGKRQFISKFGLPAEEAFEKMHFKNGLPDVGNTVLDFMSNLNPVIKAPLEQLFDTQFQTQRKLSDMKAPQAVSALGRLWNDDNPQILSQIAANSPLTRFFTSADKLMDPRKGWAQKLINLGTGVRVTDVDVDKQRAIETRAALEGMLRGQPGISQYTSFYVKPEDQANLTPQQILEMRKYTELQAAAKAYAKQKRQSIGLQP